MGFAILIIILLALCFCGYVLAGAWCYREEEEKIYEEEVHKLRERLDREEIFGIIEEEINEL